MDRRRTASVGPLVSFTSLAVLWVPLLFATAASAHEVGSSRFDAPIPLPLLFAGAAATVALTALLLAVSSEPATGGRDAPNPVGAGSASGTAESTGGARTTGVATGTDTAAPVAGRIVATVPPSIARPIRLGARLTFLCLFVGAVVSGLFGTQAGAESLATTFVWPVWIKGIGLYAILFGTPWRTLSPWRALYDALRRLEGDGTEIALFDTSPTRLGHWPALLGFAVLVGVLENLTIVPQLPRVTAAVVAGYAALMLGGAVLFGPTWFERADAFAVLYRLLGRVAPVYPTRSDEGGYRIALRAPWQGCTRSAADLVVVAFAVTAVYTVSFDGFTSTPEFQRLLFDARDALGIGGVVSLVLYLVGLCGFVCLFFAACWVMSAVADSADWRTLARSFAPTVLPIAAAYEVAHNYPFVVEGLGLLAAQVRALLTGVSADPATLLDWLSVGAFWYSQVFLIVVGHVIAVVAAHRVALAYGDTVGEARRMHAPLVVLMIGYTVLSLWIVSRPVVAG